MPIFREFGVFDFFALLTLGMVLAMGNRQKAALVDWSIPPNQQLLDSIR